MSRLIPKESEITGKEESSQKTLISFCGAEAIQLRQLTKPLIKTAARLFTPIAAANTQQLNIDGFFIFTACGKV